MINLYANLFALENPFFLVILFVGILIIFGPKRLPELARSLGRSAGELKKGLDESKQQFTASMHAESSDAEKKSADEEKKATADAAPK